MFAGNVAENHHRIFTELICQPHVWTANTKINRHHEGKPLSPRVLLVHDDPVFIEETATAIRNEGFEVVTFTGSMAALAALEELHTIELLITRIAFAPGQPHGISLAQMAQRRCSGLKVLFTALPEFAKDAADWGEFLAMPVAMPDLVSTVRRLLS